MFLRICLFLVCLFSLPLQVQAHKIHVFAWVSDNTVTVESSFSGNRPLQNGKVTVKDRQSNRVLLQGTGDERGLFTFAIPARVKDAAMDMLIVVSGSEGHQSEWLLPAEEYLSDTPPETVDNLSTNLQDPAVNEGSQPDRLPADTNIGNAELKQMLKELLEQELAPIRRSLAKAEDESPDFRDIMGGIGYLLGLAGLVAWLRNRPNKTGKKDD
jgi:nickel transport protein